MAKTPPEWSKEELRKTAEECLARHPLSLKFGEPDKQRLLHELQVHQIELELQNETLRQTQAENEQALQRLAEFNDRLEELVAVRTADLVTARDAAEAASRAKSQFLANMSHELRTPMNAIMGMTDLALRRATEPKLIDHLTKVKTASHHLLAIINDILDLSKIEAERLVLADIGFRLDSVIGNLFDMIEPQADQKGLAFNLEIAPELAQTPLRGDPMHLLQILLNLLSNAIKFTTRGSVSLRVALQDESESEVVVRFEVIDTGIGIPREDQQRIFTSFEQGDGSMTRRYGGTGLGLAISRQLAKLMGGDIEVSSSLGQGSTFRLTVPLNRSNAADLPELLVTGPAAEVRLRSEYAGMHILLAEDESITQEVSRGLLEDVLMVVDVVEDGQQALAKARQHRYALILMDVQMPVLSGLEATRAIRAESLNQNTPILAMTANAFDDDRQICLAAGMNDHIGKPVDPEKLYDTLLGWLEKPLS